MNRALLLLLAALTACATPTSTQDASDPTPRPSSTSTIAPPTATLTPLPTLAPTPTEANEASQAAAMRPEFAADVDLFPDATRYSLDLDVEFDGVQAEIDGLARIQYTNTENVALEDLALMLWPNHPQYESRMRAGPALIVGELVEPVTRSDDIAQRYSLPEPLPPGETVDLTVPFTIDRILTFERGRRFGVTNGVLFAPTAYPVIPPRVGGEWQDVNAPVSGDTTNSETAFYSVNITTDDANRLLATGIEVDRARQPDGDHSVAFTTGPVRDFAFALGPFSGASLEYDGVRINGWVVPDHLSKLERMTETAARQFELLSQLVGPYPYTELDIVDVPGGFGGIEYPGLVTIGTLDGFDSTDPIVHEVAHQWFYGLIGDDQLNEPWLDEAAATYFNVLFYEQVGGRGQATGVLSNFRDRLSEHPRPETPIGGPVEDYGLEGGYSLFVYLKGALFFDALRAELGDELFFEFLQAYFQEYRYETATAEGFQASAEAACECQLDELFDLWVNDGGTIPGT